MAGEKAADHAKGNTELSESCAIFKTKTCQEWLAFSEEWVMIGLVNTTENIGDDPLPAPHGLHPADVLGCEQMPLPARVNGELSVPNQRSRSEKTPTT